MHECPDCGQACCCDGEDTWFENNLDCTHCSEEIEDDEEGGDEDRLLSREG